jgi:uncharacterized membrane protein YedE/YeeE
MILIPSLIRAFTKKSFYNRILEEPIPYTDSLSIIGFFISGFLVGFGTKMANGCTSGHGVCGLPRLSKRSFVAVGTFLVFGLGFATLRYYVKFLENDFILDKKRKDEIIIPDNITKIISIIFFCLSIIVFILIMIFMVFKDKVYEFREILISFFVGALFSLGLMESGMVKRHLVLLFLSIGKDWDATLICVLGSAVGLNLITFNLILKKMEKPIFHNKFQLPDKKEIDAKLVIGAAIFGIGWGWAGICPGPGVLCFYFYLPQTFVFIFMVICGQLIENKIDKKIEELFNRNNEENTVKLEEDELSAGIKISRFKESQKDSQKISNSCDQENDFKDIDSSGTNPNKNKINDLAQ